jgi:ABC-type enterochelin transport system substrate-binding protein
MSSCKHLLSFAFALSLLSLASAQGTITVTHAQGETEVPVNPEVVFSYDYASIDTLQALGVTGRRDAAARALRRNELCP